MKKRKNRSYTQEFIEQAIVLARELGYSKASKQLGIPGSSIRSWLKKDEGAQMNKVKIDYEKEYRRLSKELAEQKKINIILKSAAAFFSQDHLK